MYGRCIPLLFTRHSRTWKVWIWILLFKPSRNLTRFGYTEKEKEIMRGEIMKTETINLRVTYDRLDEAILRLLGYRPLTVSQLQSALLGELHEMVSPMAIARKLDYLILLGKIEKYRKNMRIFEYNRIKIE